MNTTPTDIQADTHIHFRILDYIENNDHACNCARAMYPLFKPEHSKQTLGALLHNLHKRKLLTAHYLHHRNAAIKDLIGQRYSLSQAGFIELKKLRDTAFQTTCQITKAHVLNQPPPHSKNTASLNLNESGFP